MEIICDQCGKKLKIPDEKVPEGRKVNVICPGCKNKVSFEKKAQEAEADDLLGFDVGEEEAEDAEDASEEGASMDYGFGLTDDYEQPDRTFEFIEDEGKTALICEEDEEVKAKLKPVLDFMEYHIIDSANARDAIKKMRYNQYDLIVVNEEFDTRDPDANGVLIYLARQQMLERRKIFVAMLSRRYQTLDHMTALNKSVNMIINLNNLDDIEKILKHGLSDNDIFYRLYMENLKSIGHL